MGYVTVQQLKEKYGNLPSAAKAYLKGTMDADEVAAVEHRVAPTDVLFARIEMLEEKVDLLIKMVIGLCNRGICSGNFLG
jgi:hypothetical protein